MTIETSSRQPHPAGTTTLAYRALAVALQHSVLMETADVTTEIPSLLLNNVENKWKMFKSKYSWLPSITALTYDKLQTIDNAIDQLVIDDQHLPTLSPSNVSYFNFSSKLFALT